MNALIDNVSVLWDRLLALFSSYNIITETLDISFVAYLLLHFLFSVQLKCLKKQEEFKLSKDLFLSQLFMR